MLRWLVRLIGVGIFGVLVSRLQLDQLRQTLERTDGVAVALAIGLVIPFFILKSWRWQILLKRAGIHVSVAHSLWLYFVGLFAGYATPGQVGEAVKAMYLARDGHPTGPALATIAMDRILDLLLLLALAMPGVLFIGETLGLDRSMSILAISVALIGLLLGMWLIASPSRLAPMLRSSSTIPKLGKLLSRFSADDVGGMSMGAVMRSGPLWTLTLAAYVIHYVRYYVLLLSLHIAAPPPALAFVVTLALVSVVALIPITVMGVGTRDGVLVLAAGGLGLTHEEAVGFSLLILLTYLANLVIGFVCWVGDRAAVHG